MDLDWRVKRVPSDSSASGTPMRSFQQRKLDGSGSAREPSRGNGTFDQRPTSSGNSRFQSRDRQLSSNTSLADKVIDEGRRLYVGNLLYDTTVKDIEALFKDVSIEGVNMSVDPFTGRNPSYAFVDFKTPESAKQTMEILDGQDFRGRPLKVKPGVKSSRDRLPPKEGPSTRGSLT